MNTEKSIDVLNNLIEINDERLMVMKPLQK